MVKQDSEPARPGWRRFLPIWLGIPDRGLQAAVDDITWDGLRPAALGLGVLFGLSALIMALAFENYARLPLVALDPIAAVALLLIAYLLGRIRPRPRAAPAIGAAIMILVATNILLQMWLTRNFQWTAMIMLVMVGSAAVILAPGWLLLVFAAIWAGWLVIALSLLHPALYLIPFVFSMVVGTLVGYLVYLQRVASIRRIEGAKVEAQRAEGEMRANKERLSNILDGMEDLLWSMALPGRELIYMNAAACRVYGRTMEEFRAEPGLWMEAFPAEDRPIIMGQQARVLATGEPVNIEHRLIRSNGEVRWLYTRVRVTLEDGKPVRLDGFATDITERREAEEANRRLAVAVQATDAAIYIYGTDCKIQEVNSAFERLTGYTREEAVGQTPTALLGGQDSEAVQLDVLKTLRTGEAWRGRFINRRRDGSLYHAETTLAPIRDAGDQVVAFVGAQSDVTERMRTENELRAKSSQMVALIENLQVGVLMEDEQRRIVYANRLFCQMFGLPQSPDELAGIDLSQRASQLLKASIDDAEGLQAENAELGRQRLPVAGREIQLPDGRVFEQDYAPVFAGSDYRGQMWLYRDITARKQAEGELSKWAAQLRALYETSLEINAWQDVPTLLNAIVRRAADLLDARMGGLYLVRPDGESLELVVAHNLPGAYTGTTLRFGEGVSGRVAQTGEPLMVSDYQQWQAQAQAYVGAHFRRVLGVPLRIHGRVMGVINVTDDEKTGAFTDEEIRLVNLFADQAAIALENARLLDQLQRELAERTRVENALRYRVAFEELVTNLSTQFMALAPAEVNEAVNQALASVGSFAGVDRAYVFLFTAEGATMDNTHEWCAAGGRAANRQLAGHPQRYPPVVDSQTSPLGNHPYPPRCGAAARSQRRTGNPGVARGPFAGGGADGVGPGGGGLPGAGFGACSEELD